MTKADEGRKKIEEEAAKEALGIKAVIKKPKKKPKKKYWAVVRNLPERRRLIPTHSLDKVNILSFRKQLLSTTGEEKSDSSGQNSTSSGSSTMSTIELDLI